MCTFFQVNITDLTKVLIENLLIILYCIYICFKSNSGTSMQEFYVLCCYQCRQCQVNIVRKDTKFTCKICGQKQSVKKVSQVKKRLHVFRVKSAVCTYNAHEVCTCNAYELQYTPGL